MKQRRFCAKEIELPTRFTGVSSICLHDIYDIFFLACIHLVYTRIHGMYTNLKKKELLRLLDKTCLKYS